MVVVEVFSAVGEGVCVRVCVAVAVGEGSGVALYDGAIGSSKTGVVFETVKKLGLLHAANRKSKIARIKQVKGREGFILMFFVMFTV